MSLFGGVIDLSDDEGDSSNIFSHSARNFSAIAAERVRNQQLKREKKKQKDESVSPSKTRIRARPNKRKSDDVEEQDSKPLPRKRHESPSEEPFDIEAAIRKQEQEFQPLPTLSHREQGRAVGKENSHVHRQAGISNVDNIWEARSHDTSFASTATQDGNSVIVAPATQLQDSDEYSDDEFAEVARQARMMQKQKVQSPQRSKQTNDFTNEVPSPAKADDPSKSVAMDPVVEIFVASDIPDTKPLRVRYQLRRPFKKLRLEWCTRQGIPEDERSAIFLTYRLRRIYDVSNCESLGFYEDGEGVVALRGAEGKRGVEKIHLEATDEVRYAAAKQKQATLRATAAAELDANHAEAHQAYLETRQENSETQQDDARTQLAGSERIKLILRSSDRVDYKIIAKRDTTISRIIRAYRRQYGIDDSSSITLFFDGESLAEDLQLGEREIADEDAIDVHVK